MQGGCMGLSKVPPRPGPLWAVRASQPPIPETQGKTAAPPLPPAPCGDRPPELFTLGTDTGGRGHRGVCAEQQEGRPRAVRALPPPAPRGMARFTTARWRPAGAAGLSAHCDRLTPRKRGQSPGPGATPLSPGGAGAGQRAAPSTSHTHSRQNQTEPAEQARGPAGVSGRVQPPTPRPPGKKLISAHAPPGKGLCRHQGCRLALHPDWAAQLSACPTGQSAPHTPARGANCTPLACWAPRPLSWAPCPRCSVTAQSQHRGTDRAQPAAAGASQQLLGLTGPPSSGELVAGHSAKTWDKNCVDTQRPRLALGPEWAARGVPGTCSGAGGGTRSHPGAPSSETFPVLWPPPGTHVPCSAPHRQDWGADALDPRDPPGPGVSRPHSPRETAGKGAAGGDDSPRGTQPHLLPCPSRTGSPESRRLAQKGPCCPGAPAAPHRQPRLRSGPAPGHAGAPAASSSSALRGAAAGLSGQSRHPCSSSAPTEPKRP